MASAARFTNIPRNRHLVHTRRQAPNQQGTRLTIEPFLSKGGHWATEGDDDWTLYSDLHAPVVQYEHTMVATDRGAIVVTLPD